MPLSILVSGTGTHTGTGTKEKKVSRGVGPQNANRTKKLISSFREYWPR